MIIYVDMDDVLAVYSKAKKQFLKDHPEIEFPQSQKCFFQNLEPVKDCQYAISRLSEIGEVYVLTAPSYRNPLSYTEKRIWIEQYFGLEFCLKLIICRNKGLLKGDYLIDDHVSGRGQENFEGQIMQFGSELFPDWKAVLKYFTLNVL